MADVRITIKMEKGDGCKHTKNKINIIKCKNNKIIYSCIGMINSEEIIVKCIDIRIINIPA